MRSWLCARIVLMHMAKCILGKVNLKSMCPVVFSTNMHAGWLHMFASD